MNLLKLRTWFVIAALVMLQAPMTIAASKPAHHAKVDRQLESLQASGATGTVHVVVRFDRGALASTKALMKAHGLKLRRQFDRSGVFTIDVAGKDVAWLQNLPGVLSISNDAPVSAPPLVMGESYLDGDTTGTGTSALRAIVGLSET